MGGGQGYKMLGVCSLLSFNPFPKETQGCQGVAREGTGCWGCNGILFAAPQVIRKIRVEQFPDSSGSLKLWCQFFNIVSDSVLTWAKDQHPVGEVSRR